MSSTCRFCDDWSDQMMVKYGVRHYAHFHCYLDAGKALADLQPWQVRQFPYKLLKERGLLAEIAAADERERRQDAEYQARVAAARAQAGEAS